MGDPTHFYSLHNIASIITELNDGNNNVKVVDNFEVENEMGQSYDGTVMPELVGKKLGVWLVEEDIYFTLTFNTWEQVKEEILEVYLILVPQNKCRQPVNTVSELKQRLPEIIR